MTDNEIITAMEWCYGGTSDNCRSCPLEGVAFCIDRLEDESIKLIKQQKAEIERLKEDNEYILMQHKFDRRPNGDCWNDVIKKAKSEAIREFAERLKEMASQTFWESDAYVGTEQIDSLAKEMKEEKE